MYALVNLRSKRNSLALLAAAALALAGCSSNPNAIEPNPLPDFEREFKVDRAWSTGIGEGIDKAWLRLQPAVTHRAVYAADLEGLVEAHELERGKRLWRARTDDRISGGLYAGYGKVVYGTREGDVVALSEDDGSELWRIRLSSEVLSPAAMNASLAVVQTLDGQVVALDSETGEERWRFDNPVPILILRGAATPTIVGDRVYVAFANGKVAALDIENGIPVWERRVAEPTGRSELERLVDISNNLIVEGGGVFSATFQGSVAVLDQEAGRPYWTKDMSTSTQMASALGSLFVADSTGHVWAIDQRTGNTLWKLDLLYGRGLTGVAVQRGQVVVGDAEGYLHWIDAASGRITARTRHHRKGFAAAPVVRDDVLYVYGRRGRLAAYVLEDR